MAIRPLAERWNDERQEMEFLLSDADFEKVRQGYGCSYCLEDFHGMWLAKCPTCGTEGFDARETKDASFRQVAT